MRAVLLDLDGVLYVGDSAVPGAAAVVAWLAAEDVPHLLLTNTTSRPRSAVVAKLEGLGMPVDPSRLLTPAVAAVDWMRARRLTRPALFVPTATAVELSEFDPLPPDEESGAGAVVVGDLGDGWDFAVLNRAFRLLMADPRPPLVALGMTRYWRAPDGLRLDTGAFVAALEQAAGTRAVVLGKPAATFYQAALARLGHPAAEVVMVGDDIRTDVDGAQRAGLAGVLVRTGKFAPADLDGDITPSAVLDTIADLPGWWDSRPP
jgi:phospholysine phosphohistidine inorganic pyrophosphate phosphatase